MTRPALYPVLALVAVLILGLAPGARAFRGWDGVPVGDAGIETSGATGALGLVRKAGRTLDTFAAVGAGERSDGFSPWLGTGVQWKPTAGLKLSIEGRAVLPDPSVYADTLSSGLMGGITIDFTGW